MADFERNNTGYPESVGPMEARMTRFAFLMLCFAVPFASAQAQGQAPSDPGGMAYPAPVPGSGETRSDPSQARSQGQAPSDPGGMTYPAPVPGSGERH